MVAIGESDRPFVVWQTIGPTGAASVYIRRFNGTTGFVDVTTGSASGAGVNGPDVQGLALAPAGFGKYSNDLLVGNFGDSHVSAFDPATGNYLGQLSDAQGKPLVLLGGFPTGPSGAKGLWALRFGNGSGSGPATTLYFTSGVNFEADGLLGTFNALLSIAEAESGSRRAQLAEIDLGEIAHSVAELYEPFAEERGLALDVAADRPAPVRGDRHLLAQATANLIDNALKYTDAGKVEIIVSADADGLS